MNTNAVKCSICGESPKTQGGVSGHCVRLVCPNYKNEKIQHGNESIDYRHLPKGFTEWNYICWTKEQEYKAIEDLIKEWNEMHNI